MVSQKVSNVFNLLEAALNEDDHEIVYVLKYSTRLYKTCQGKIDKRDSFVEHSSVCMGFTMSEEEFTMT